MSYTQTPLADSSGVIAGRAVSVAPTDTTIVDAVSCRAFEDLSITLTNDDGSQTLDAWVEMGPESSGPWNRSDWAGLETIAAGESRSEVAEVRGRQFVRIVGAASGAGLDCRIWLFKVNR